jgi:hypothetical protein
MFLDLLKDKRLPARGECVSYGCSRELSYFNEVNREGVIAQKESQQTRKYAQKYFSHVGHLINFTLVRIQIQEISWANP